MKTISQQLNVKDFPFTIRDKNGNVIYWENSDGYWSKSEFDSNGKEIYFENSSGYWRKCEYDSNGNIIYYENSSGYWRKCEFDSNGKEIYYEDSSGYLVLDTAMPIWPLKDPDQALHIEDNRPKGCEGKVVEIDGKKYKLTEIK